MQNLLFTMRNSTLIDIVCHPFSASIAMSLNIIINVSDSRPFIILCDCH